LVLSLSASLAQAGCEEAYKLKSEKMFPRSVGGQVAVSAGTFLVVGGAMAGTITLGAGPVGLLAMTPVVAYSRKATRLEFYSSLIQSVNAKVSSNFANWSAPVVETFWGDFQTAGPDNYSIGQTIFDRIRNHVLRESGNVTDQQIAQAIYKANLKSEFCSNNKGEVDFKTSVKGFAEVISSNLDD